MPFPLYVFDAYGTLFDVHSAVARHRELAGPQAERLSDIWRTKQLEYTWTRSLMGAYRDFDLLTRDALDFAAARCGGLTSEARKTLLSAYETLDAYADAAPALAALRDAGRADGDSVQWNAGGPGARRALGRSGKPSRRVALGRRFADLQDRAGRLSDWFASIMACGPGRFPSSRPIAGTWRARQNLAFARSGSTGPARRMNIRICPRPEYHEPRGTGRLKQKKRPPEEPAAQV